MDYNSLIGFPIINIVSAQKMKNIPIYGENTFLFDSSPYVKKFFPVLGKSKPKRASKLVFEETLFDFDCGEFTLNLVNPKNKKFVIPFLGDDYPIIKFWKFLEEAATTDFPVIFSIEHDKVQTVVYIASLEESFARLIVLNTRELRKKVALKRISRCFLYKGEIDIDIVMKKAVLIRSFYDVMYSLFYDFAPNAYFEPLNKNLSGWIKSSEIIRKYLERVEYKKPSKKK